MAVLCIIVVFCILRRYMKSTKNSFLLLVLEFWGFILKRDCDSLSAEGKVFIIFMQYDLVISREAFG